MPDENTPESAPEVPIPAPSDAAPAPAPAPASAPDSVEPSSARKIWPFVVGGAALVLVLVIAAIVVVVVTIVTALGSDPKKAVSDYDLSFKNADCALFQSTTTPEFQQAFFGGDLDCAQWEENARALTIDGVYQYEVQIVSSEIDGDSAEVVTEETDSSSGSATDYALRYYLTRSSGHWLVDDIDDETSE